MANSCGSGVHRDYIFAIRRMYDAMQATVAVIGVHSKVFNVCRGVRQGDPLSAIIFSAVMEWALQSAVSQWETESFRIDTGGERTLTNLRFADDMHSLNPSKSFCR